MSHRFERIDGVVSELRIFEGEQEFLSSATRVVATGVATALAATGMPGVAAGTATAMSGGADSVEFFKCKLGARDIEGAFSKVTFRDGDQVSAVIERDSSGTALAGAVFRARDDLLWMRPHRSRGMHAHLRYSVRLAFYVALAFAPILALTVWLGTRGAGNKLEAFELLISISVVFMLTASLYYSIRFYWQWRQVAKEASEVFEALGCSNPSMVDLPRTNTRYGRANGILWPYKTDGPWIYRVAIEDGKMSMASR